MKLLGLLSGLITTSISQIFLFVYDNLSLQDFKKHILVYEGIPLSYTFLFIYWYTGLLPKTYYNLTFKFETTKFITMLLLQDFIQFISHLIAHKLKLRYHIPHHKAIIPKTIDAFQGSILDTILMVLLPLFFTLQVIQTNCLTLQIFGSFYSSYLILIHANYEHKWEKYTSKLGFLTTKDHREHHKRRIVNFGHIFIFWDLIFKTYYKEISY